MHNENFYRKIRSDIFTFDYYFTGSRSDTAQNFA